jgi:hypothetical protein
MIAHQMNRGVSVGAILVEPASVPNRSWDANPAKAAKALPMRFREASGSGLAGLATLAAGSVAGTLAPQSRGGWTPLPAPRRAGGESQTEVGDA